MMARIPTYAWRAAILGPSYALASALAPALLAVLGLGDGFSSGQDDPAATLARLAVAGALAGTALGLISQRLALDRRRRWLLLAGLVAGVTVLNLVEGLFFAPGFATGDLALGLVGPVTGAAVLAGFVVLLYGPVGRPLSGWQAASLTMERRSGGAWAWRLAVAGLAYVVIYLVFGALVGPIVLPYYALAGSGLAIPGFDVIIPLELARGLGFSLLAWPLIAALRGSGARPLGWTALTLIVLAGWLPMIQVGGLPPTLRIIHALELTADGLAHAWVLVKLLDPDARPGWLP